MIRQFDELSKRVVLVIRQGLFSLDGSDSFDCLVIELDLDLMTADLDQFDQEADLRKSYLCVCFCAFDQRFDRA